MKKIAALLLALAMVLCLVACGEKAPEAPATPDEVKGKTHDTGAFTVLIPEGWLAVPVGDMWTDEDGFLSEAGQTRTCVRKNVDD